VRLAFSIPEVARLLAVSERTIYRQVAAGEIRALSVGYRKVIPVVEIERLIGAPINWQEAS
jgi:excisionase family DNA binding protein